MNAASRNPDSKVITAEEEVMKVEDSGLLPLRRAKSDSEVTVIDENPVKIEEDRVKTEMCASPRRSGRLSVISVSSDGTEYGPIRRSYRLATSPSYGAGMPYAGPAASDFQLACGSGYVGDRLYPMQCYRQGDRIFA